MTNYYVSGKELKELDGKNNNFSNSNVYSNNSTNLNSTLNNSSQNYSFQNNYTPYVFESVLNSYTPYNPDPIANSVGNSANDYKNTESSYYLNQNGDGNNITSSLNSNLSYNENLNKSGNNYINSYAPKNNEIPITNKNLFLTGSDFSNKNANSDAINSNKSLENPISSQITYEQGSSIAYDLPKDTLNNNSISNLNVVSAGNATKLKSVDNYKSEIDQMIKETLDKAGLPYQPTVKTSNDEPTTVHKYYSSATSLYDSNTANPNDIRKPAYRSFAKTYHGATGFTSKEQIKIENKTVILPSYESEYKGEILLNDSGYPNYVNAMASNDMSTNNNLYNEQITFKDNLSNNGSVNLFNSTKEKNYNTILSNQNYTFENLKSEENLEKKDLAASGAPAGPIPAKAEEILSENLNKSSNEQFKASAAILENSAKSTNKPESASNQNHNSYGMSNLKKNEDMILVSNKNPNIKNQDSARQSAKEKTKVITQGNNEKKEDYLNTQASISNFQKEFLSEEDFKNLQFDLGKTYSKELCGEQISIISKYLEIGKILTSMLPGILNNVNPLNRMDAFKILISNIHDWPNDESYFNGVICFLPTANQKEAMDIVKRMNRSNCCCTVF